MSRRRALIGEERAELWDVTRTRNTFPPSDMVVQASTARTYDFSRYYDSVSRTGILYGTEYDYGVLSSLTQESITFNLGESSWLGVGFPYQLQAGKEYVFQYETSSPNVYVTIGLCNADGTIYTPNNFVDAGIPKHFNAPQSGIVFISFCCSVAGTTNTVGGISLKEA